jgi:hypothetical protein
VVLEWLMRDTSSNGAHANGSNGASPPSRIERSELDLSGQEEQR